MTSRVFNESPLYQGPEEEITYNLTTTPWGSSPSAPVVKVYDITDGGSLDVTSTVMPVGSASASGDVITFPELKSLTQGHEYRIEVKFTSGGNIFEPYGKVICN